MALNRFKAPFICGLRELQDSEFSRVLPRFAAAATHEDPRVEADRETVHVSHIPRLIWKLRRHPRSAERSGAQVFKHAHRRQGEPFTKRNLKTLSGRVAAGGIERFAREGCHEFCLGKALRPRRSLALL